MALRAGLIGAGMMGRHHARVLQHLDGVELVGVADPQGDRHHAADGVPIVATLHELLNLGIDYCVVATPATTHATIGHQLATRKIPTLIEKPLATSLADATSLTAAFSVSRTLAAVGHVERYNPAVRSLRTRIAGHTLGRIYQIDTRRQGPNPRRITDTGVALDLATHDIDLTTYITGRRITTVTARTAARRDSEYEDILACICDLGDGAFSTHHVTRLAPTTQRRITVISEHGYLEADTVTNTLTFSPSTPGAAPIVREQAHAPNDPLRMEHETFRDTLQGQSCQMNIVTLPEATDAVAVAEAMRNSARTPTPSAAGDPLPCHRAGAIPSSR
jgi:predicted dehydrogenase